MTRKPRLSREYGWRAVQGTHLLLLRILQMITFSCFDCGCEFELSEAQACFAHGCPSCGSTSVDEIDPPCGDDGEAFLREREAFAAYQAAGCAHSYWDDRNAGYV